MWLTLEKSRHRVAIAGQVSDAETGQVIVGASVALTQVPEAFSKRLALQSLQYGDRWATLSNRPDRTYTATDGYFKFIDLPIGNYTLIVSLPTAGTRYGVAEATVAVSDRLKPIAVALPPTALKGQIRDGQQKPIELAKIQIEGISESVLSDAQGNYQFTGLETSLANPKPRMVSASAQGYDAQSNAIVLNLGKTQILNFDLQRKHSKPVGAPNGSQ